MKRRDQRILKTVLPGIAFVGLVLWLTLAGPFRSKPTAYSPDEENLDVTRALDIEASDHPPVAFVDRSLEAGLDFTHFRGGTRTSRLPEDMGVGAAWGDYDNDGDDDLYLVDLAFAMGAGSVAGETASAGETVPAADATGGRDNRLRESQAATNGRGNRLYENQGDGTFVDVTARSGTGAALIGMGAAWSDLDGDGFLDLLTTGYRSLRLFRNRGDGTFEDVTDRTGLAQDGFYSGIAIADFDRDSDLDVYICAYVDYDDDHADQVREATMQYRMAVPFSLNPSSFRDSPNRLYRNDGGLRFTDVAKSAGVDGEVDGRVIGKSLGAVWIDVSEDGWPDLYVSNDVSNNHLFLNRRDGTFEEVGAIAWVADPRGSMGIAVGDFDNDRDLDLFVSHWIAQENALYVNLARENHGPERGVPAIQSGDVLFADRADVLGLGQSALDFVGWGTSFFDFDNDGFLDLFVANGSTFEIPEDPTHLTPMRSILYRNLGTKTSPRDPDGPPTHQGFSDCVEFAGPFFEEEHVARGFTRCDYDRDGDLDLLVCVFGESVRLLRNENETDHHWLGLRLRGTKSNRFAIGAEVRIKTPSFVRVELIGSDVSYLSGSVTDTHIGLGGDSGPVLVEVIWPNGVNGNGADANGAGGPTGRSQIFEIDQVDCTVLLTEGEDDPVYLEAPGGRAQSQREKHPLGAGGSRLKGADYVAFQTAFREATRLRIGRQYATAESLYRVALELDPAHVDSRYYLGSVLLDQNRFDEARQAWESLLEVEAASSKGNFMLGVVHACPLAGAPTDLAAAEGYFEKVFALNKEDSGVVLRLGEVALARGDLDRARARLEAGVGSNFSSSEGHFLLAYVLWKQGEEERAHEEMALALDYAGNEGMPERAESGALTEGDIEDPKMLRLTDVYRVRPLAGRVLGLGGRAESLDLPELCGSEFSFLDRRIEALRRRD